MTLDLLTVLLAIRADLPNLIPEDNLGICNQIYQQCLRNNPKDPIGRSDAALQANNLNDLAMDMWAKWPKFSGDAKFPVPSPNLIQSPCTAFLSIALTWQGQYGADRIELLDWLINELQV